mgnify:CR=1 FL=1
MTARAARVLSAGLRPATRLVALAAAWFAAGVAAYIWTPDMVGIWLVAGLLVAAGAALDAYRGVRIVPGLRVRRRLPERWPVDSPVDVVLEIDAPALDKSLALRVHDLHTPRVRACRLPLTCRLAPGHRQRLRWRATATRRGALELSGVDVAWPSPIGLWWRQQRLECRDRARVYPNFNLVVQYGRLAGDRHLERMGIHLQRRRGSGSDFDQLRDYREGDSLRRIDWHSTSRLRRLIAKDYREERDQRVIFLLDCSRRMRALDGELSHFDQCLNALLLLAHVALRQGDEVALQTLAEADRAPRLLPPGRGQRQFGTLLETVYDLEAGFGHPDFLAAATALANRQRRRALVIWLTNLRDEDHTDLDPALALLRRRHLVVVADLRERLDEAEGDDALTEALLDAGRVLYREQRRRATRRLRQLGVFHLDVTAAALPAALVSQYRALKASGLL